METADKSGRKLWLPSWKGVIITLLVGSNIILIRIITAPIYKGQSSEVLCVNCTRTLADLHNEEIRMMEIKKQLCVATTGEPAGCVVCPVGWLWHRGSCYYISSNGDVRKWNESRDMCERMGAHLLVIEDLEEQEFIDRSIRGQDHEEFWIGVYRAGDEWRWMDGRHYDTSLFRTSERSSGDCIRIHAGSGHFNGDCQSTHGWICEKRALKM